MEHWQTSQQKLGRQPFIAGGSSFRGRGSTVPGSTESWMLTLVQMESPGKISGMLVDDQTGYTSFQQQIQF